MCGIAGAVDLVGRPIPDLDRRLAAMNELQKHRGPDGHAIWLAGDRRAGLAHRRLSIIGLDESGIQPLRNDDDRLVFNGEIYNYLELQRDLGRDRFRTTTDSEVILHGYRDHGPGVVDALRGMFAFALWDGRRRRLVCGRDRFGIKPFYYTIVDGVFMFASEAKALLPFLPSVEVDPEALADYTTFQFCLGGKTLFAGVQELPPAHLLIVEDGRVRVERYWEVYYGRDFDHSAHHFEDGVRRLLDESIDLHLRSDVPVGAYVSGGIDSSLVAALARPKYGGGRLLGFTGKFAIGDEFDESKYARAVADRQGFDLYERDIGVEDFLENIRKVIYHLDYPVAGPGSFPQYMVSQLAAEHRKVVLGGQGGDETFGGYARYLLAYFEQCIKGAIEGTLHAGNFVVTYESIIPNLRILERYKPLIRTFWSDGLFGPMDERYFRLINRAPAAGAELRLPDMAYSPRDAFFELFNAENVAEGSYFDAMSHFDFKTLLPALLHVEDRMSMAHGLEARVPLLDHPLIEFAATIPADIKFRNGELKRLLRTVAVDVLPAEVVAREDKMGFPVPLTRWMRSDARDFFNDVFRTGAIRDRPYVDNAAVAGMLDGEQSFGRTVWGYLCLELWYQEFVDRAADFRKIVETAPEQPVVA